jgi:hypothetical protein
MDEWWNKDEILALPELKPITNNLEAEVTPFIMEWFLRNWPKDVIGEVKIKGNYPKPHQKAVLKEVVAGEFSYKFPDGRSRTPGDFVTLVVADAFVITYDPTKETYLCEKFGAMEPISFVVKRH